MIPSCVECVCNIDELFCISNWAFPLLKTNTQAKQKKRKTKLA